MDVLHLLWNSVCTLYSSKRTVKTSHFTGSTHMYTCIYLCTHVCAYSYTFVLRNFPTRDLVY